jgi:predicted phage baseplate assembly protein
MSSFTATCGCCSGVAQHTPLEVENRPGLSAIAYRVGVHGDFLASMIAALTDEDRPSLADLGTRDRDDFSIALLDAWAVASDVLAFYTERLANESYLRTARERISLQELGRLIGYRLRPGVAAETYAAFALEPPPEVPAASKDPGSAPPVTPAVVTLEPGTRLQSIPGPGEKPQTFETAEELEARPEWNAMPASTTKASTPGSGDTEAHFAGAVLNLKPGDVLLFGTGAPVLLRTLTSVVAHPEAEVERTDVAWVGALESDPGGTAQAYALRKRFNVFGHNAPLASLFPEASQTDWDFDLSTEPNTPDASYVDLEGSHPEIVPESFIVLAQPGKDPQLFEVAEVSELSRADYAVSGNVTRLKLTGGDIADYEKMVRETTVFGVSEPLKLAEAPDHTAVEDDTIEVDADVSKMQPGRRLLVRGTTADADEEEHAEAAVVKSVAQIPGGWQITLESDLAKHYQRDTVIVYGNVALATHGETVEQILGSGRARDPFQRFTLAHEPLTHLQSTDSPSGAAPALEVRVNDVRWDEAATLFGARLGERVYALRTDEHGKAYVQFGDGERGARVPTGSNNVRAKYRKGIGAAGNVTPGALAQLLDRPLGVKGVSNPMAASGGVDPETEDAARTSIPLGVRTLGRAVSLLDYEDYARAFTGVVKANATVLPLRGGRTIVVTVAFEGGERLDDLADALKSHGDPRVQVLVLEGTTETFRLALKVVVDPAYEQDAVLSGVEAALREAYSFEAHGLGEPVFSSEVVATAHTVAGVLGIDVDALYTGATSGLADRLIAQRPDVDSAGDAIPAGVLVLHEDPFDALEAVKP